MLALVLVVALVAQAIQGAPSPTNCGELCDTLPMSSSSSGYSSKSSYSRFSKSNYGGSSRMGSSGLGATGARLENFDENVIGTSGLNRPGNWEDEKHYITDDGRGKMHYHAGQTVTNNGYSKFAEHSYSYGTHDSNARLSNAQVLSTQEFNQRLQNIRDEIRSFMGNYALGTGSIINSNFLQEFQNKASIISNQMNDVCSQYDTSSAMYQQMRQAQQQFLRDVEQREREIQAEIIHSSSVSSETHGSVSYYPKRPAASLTEQTTRPTAVEDTLAIQRTSEHINQVQNEINNFWNSFSHVETGFQFQQNFKTKVDVITKQLGQLNQNVAPSESLRQQIKNLKTQFSSFVTTITSYIKDSERRNQDEEEAKILERQEKLQREQKTCEDQLNIVKTETYRLQEQLDYEKAQYQKLEIQVQHNLDQQKQRQNQLLAEQQRLQEQQQTINQDKHQLEQQKLEFEQKQNELQTYIEQQQQHLQQLEIVSAPIRQQPYPTETVSVSGSSSYEHTIKTSNGAQIQENTSGSSSSYTHGNRQSSYTKPQAMLQSHVDITAAVNKLQQDLNRLQSEVNNFNMYTMRLTASNSASVVSEANSQASSLRQRLTDLCSSSKKYQNQQLLSSAEELQRNFDQMFQDLQNQAAGYTHGSGSSFSASAGYSSESSYGTSGSYATAHAPKITDVEYTHSKNTEIEVKRRPASSRRYSGSSGYSASSGYSSGSSHGSQVECVEAQAGQPCLDASGRRKREAGEFDSILSARQQNRNYAQQYQPIFEDFSQFDKNEGFRPRSFKLEDYLQSRIGPNIGILSLDPSSKIEDSLDRARSINSHNYQSLQNQELTQDNQHLFQPQNRENEGSTRQEKYDDYLHRNSQDQVIHSIASTKAPHRDQNMDLSQQHVDFGRNENLESLQKPRSYNNENFRQQNKLFDISTNEKSQHIQPVFEESVTFNEAEIPHQSKNIQKTQNYRPDNSETSDSINESESLPIETKNYEHNQNFLSNKSNSNRLTIENIKPNLNYDKEHMQTHLPQKEVEKQEHLNFSDLTHKQSSLGSEKQILVDRSKQGTVDKTPEINSLTQQKKTENTAPLRGDLPGISEPATEEESEHDNIQPENPKTNEHVIDIDEEQSDKIKTEIQPKVTETKTDIKSEISETKIENKEIKSSNSKEYVDHIQTQITDTVDLNKNNQSHDTKKKIIECTKNESEHNHFSHSNGGYYYNSQNYKYTQHSNYFSHQSNLAKQNENPSIQQNTYSQRNYFMKPMEFIPQLQPTTYQWHEQQVQNYKAKNIDLEPRITNQFEQQRDHFKFFQQYQKPIMSQPLIESPEITQQPRFIPFDKEARKKLESSYKATVREINRTSLTDTWSDMEPTTQRTFWKRVGQKLSYSYEKAKEKAVTIFG